MKEAEQLCRLKWDEAYNGLTVRQPKFGIVVPGVPTDWINPNEIQNPEIVRELEYQNTGYELQIAGMKSLQQKLNNINHNFSLVIFFTSPEMANQCIKHGIYFNQQQFPSEKYTPQFQLTQCYKCQQFRHHATTCKSLHNTCAKCSEHHPTSKCQSKTHKCAACKGEHPAWH